MGERTPAGRVQHADDGTGWALPLGRTSCHVRRQAVHNDIVVHARWLEKNSPDASSVVVTHVMALGADVAQKGLLYVSLKRVLK